ncbi:unnamed protein product [Urochloa humidicola]
MDVLPKVKKGDAPRRATTTPMAKILVRSEEALVVLEVVDGDGPGRWPCCPVGRRSWHGKRSIVSTAGAMSWTMSNFLVPVDTMRKNDDNYKGILMRVRWSLSASPPEKKTDETVTRGLS